MADLSSENSKITTLLDVLVPEGDIEITDISGHVHKIRSVLPARAQLRVLRQLQKVLDLGVGDAFGALAAEEETDWMKLIQGILAATEEAEGPLAAAFAEAHPAALREALANREDPSVPGNAFDVFSFEEILVALVPFVARVLRRALALVPAAAALPTA